MGGVIVYRNQSSKRAMLATCALSSILVASGAAAQEASPAEPGAVSEVVVTGTRLQSGFTTPTPVTVIGGRQLEQRAPSTIADVLLEIPSFRNSTSLLINTRNVLGTQGGQMNPDLRGLGAQRTLVLVDGRRFVPNRSDTMSVDSNQIPTSLVERVDVVTGGASAAYGSDAVAGVVNFVLKDRLQGVTGTIQRGQSKLGDYRENVVSLGAGGSFLGGRAHFIVGADYSENEGVGNWYTRDWGRKEPGRIALGATRARGLPAQAYIEGVQSVNTPGGVITSGPLKGTAFGPNGTTYQLQYGTVAGIDMYGVNSNPGTCQYCIFQIATPLERYASMARVNFDVNDDTTVFAEFNRSHADNTGSYGNIEQSTALIIGRDNPFLPQSVRDQMTARNLATITVGRFNFDLGSARAITKTDVWRYVLGAKGRIFGDWSWDAHVQSGKTKLNFLIPNMMDLPNHQAAVSVITGPNGQPTCAPIATNPNLNAEQRPLVEAGCVPFNIFGSGQGSAAAYDYVTNPVTSITHIKQTSVGANLAGEPINLPAGPLSVAVGAEYRTEFDAESSNPRAMAAAFRTANRGSFSGKQWVYEGYAEVGVPVLRDMPMVQALDLNAAVRRTNYQYSGGVTTWKVGLTYDMMPALRFRGTLSRDIRAPNLWELFTTGVLQGGTGFNPFTNQTGRTLNRTVGNLNLLPEKSDSLTLGVVVQPTWQILTGLRASVDYYDIEIKGVIGTISDVVQRCYEGQKQYCANVVFDNSIFGIAQTNNTYANLNARRINGYDFELQYRVPLDMMGVPGSLDFRNLTSLIDHNTTIDPGRITENAGVVVSKVSGNASLTYTLGRFSSNLQARYFGKAKFSATAVEPGDANYDSTLAESVSRNTLPGLPYFSLQAQYNLIDSDERRLQIFGIVNNLMDKDPPFGGAQTPFGSYDLIGRTFKAGVRFNF